MLDPNIAGAGADPPPKAGAAGEWLTPWRFGIVLGLLVVATFPGILAGRATFNVRDFGLFGYPLAHFHRQSFWRGELPLWNPLNNCGLPFLAQWNTLTLYPLSLIYLLLPLAWSLSFFCLAHMFFGGMGMYFLAFRWTRHRLAAALAGLIFAFNGLTLNTLMWPNIVACLGWLPWVVWLGQRAWQEGGKSLVWAALAGAMQMLAAGPEVILLTWVILLALACGDWAHREGPRSRIPIRFLAMALLVALVCAAQLLPFVELLAHSQRDRGYSSASHDWSMPFWGWANFLVPLFRSTPTAQGVFFQNGQYWTSSYYAGIGTVLLGAVAVRRVRNWRVWVLAALLLLGLVLALGDGSLLYRGLRLFVPGIGFLRYPVKFVILVLAVAPLLAAFGLQALAVQTRRLDRFEFGCALALLALMAVIVALEWKSSIPDDVWRATWRSAVSRAGFLVLVFCIAALLPRAQGRRRDLLAGLLLVVFWLDFVTQMPTQNPGVRPFVYAPGRAGARLNWNRQPRLGQSRALLGAAALEVLRYNPLSSLEETYVRNRLAARADCNLLDDVPVIDGFFSLTPREVSTATMLPYDQRGREFPALLDFMAVSQTTVPGATVQWAPRHTAMPLVTAGQQPVFADDETVLAAFCQTNLDLRQIVFLPIEARGKISVSRQTGARVLATDFANQKIDIQTEAPAPSLVVISQTDYPAWKASVDGRAVKIWRANYAFQAIEIPAGKHHLQLRYEDSRFVAGAALSGLGLLACLSLWLTAHFWPTPGASRSSNGLRTSAANGRV